MKELIKLDGNSLTIDDAVAVARFNAKVEVTDAAKEKIKEARKYVEEIVEKNLPVYGITTGFGKFSTVSISEEKTNELQVNLIRSHSVGVGEPFEKEIVRIMLLLRANAMCRGNSGVKLETVECMVEMLNKGVTPVVRSQGSVGASGDLCPLSHMVLPMLGEGESYYEGEILSGKDAMKKAGIKTITLGAKEGLALNNGTQAMMGNLVLAVYDTEKLLKTADISAAMSFEALEGVIDAYDKRIQELRPHQGQIDVAENMRTLLKNSKLATRQGEKRIQDSYSLRCVPQIHGASRLAFEYVKKTVETELNAVTDNPLIFLGENEGAISGGNFHGQPLAIAADTLGILVSEIADVSERRVEKLVNPALSNGLPAFLAKHGGLNSGFMIAQYTCAALVSENKVLSHPASVDSIPTSANQEDHVSMGTIAARHARQIIKNVQHVLSIEIAAATQGVDFRDPEKLGEGTKAAYKLVRKHLDFIEKDLIMYKEMDKVFELVENGEILKEVEDTIGELK